MQRRVLGERSIGNRLADAGEFLAHHAAGADVQVPDFRIAHLAVWQPDIPAAGIEEGARAGRP